MSVERSYTKVSLWVVTESGKPIAHTIRYSGSLSVPLIATYTFSNENVKETMALLDEDKETRIVYEGHPLFGKVISPDGVETLLGPGDIDFYIEGLSDNMGDYNRINLVFLGCTEPSRYFIDNEFKIALVTREEEKCNEVIITVESAYIVFKSTDSE